MRGQEKEPLDMDSAMANVIKWGWISLITITLLLILCGVGGYLSLKAMDAQESRNAREYQREHELREKCIDAKGSWLFGGCVKL